MQARTRAAAVTAHRRDHDGTHLGGEDAAFKLRNVAALARLLVGGGLCQNIGRLNCLLQHVRRIMGADRPRGHLVQILRPQVFRFTPAMPKRGLAGFGVAVAAGGTGPDRIAVFRAGRCKGLCLVAVTCGGDLHGLSGDFFSAFRAVDHLVIAARRGTGGRHFVFDLSFAGRVPGGRNRLGAAIAADRAG